MDKIEKKDIWKSDCQPQTRQLVVVIDEDGVIDESGYFHIQSYVNVEGGFKWADMQDLVNITNNKNE